MGIDPKYAKAWYNKGLTLYNLGKHNEAIECYDKVLGIDPKYAKALANRDLALKLLGRQPGGGKKSGWKRFFK